MTLMILDEAAGWTELGGISSVTLSDEQLDAIPLDKGWGDRFNEAMKTLTQTFTHTFTVSSVAAETLRLVFGGPVHPVKGHPHTGKRYRQECRRYQRELKAWRKRGLL